MYIFFSYRISEWMFKEDSHFLFFTLFLVYLSEDYLNKTVIGFALNTYSVIPSNILNVCLVLSIKT